MMKGFITTANLFNTDKEDNTQVDLNIVDLEPVLVEGEGDEPDELDGEIIDIRFKGLEIDAILSFDLDQARAHVEAMQEIISRYEK